MLEPDASTEFLRLIGENIKKKRIKKDWTQEELGLEIGLTRMKVSRIEKGYNITLTTLLKLALALDVKPENIIKVNFISKKEDLEGLVENLSLIHI